MIQDAVVHCVQVCTKSNTGGSAMSETFTKSMARNIYLGGSVFFFLLFLALTFDTNSALPDRDNRGAITPQPKMPSPHGSLSREKTVHPIPKTACRISKRPSHPP